MYSDDEIRNMTQETAVFWSIIFSNFTHNELIDLEVWAQRVEALWN
jgi:hypothetical protein